MNYDELKILLYKYLDSIEYEFDRRFRVASNNYLICNYIEDSETCLKLLELHKAQCQRDVIKQISLDIHKILCNN